MSQQKTSVGRTGKARADFLERILMAGSGGQGIVTLGRLLANAALRNTPHITFFPNYGAEVRGGMSNCQVILSSREIASPVASRFDAMIIMDPASARAHLGCLADDGLALVNSSLCAEVKPAPQVALIPATEEADRLGDTRAANLIMLGALLARRPCVPPAAVEIGIVAMLKSKDPDLLGLNLKAFQSGLKMKT